MAAKKKQSAEKELKATVKKLRSRLERAEARAERWKKKAGQHAKSADAAQAQVKKLAKRNKRLEEQSARGAADEVHTSSPVSVDTAARSNGVPDDTWTVVQLRTEARDRGLTGLSGKSKAQLLEALA